MRPFNLNSNLKKNNKLLLKQKPLQDDQHDNTGANNGPKVIIVFNLSLFSTRQY